MLLQFLSKLNVFLKAVIFTGRQVELNCYIYLFWVRSSGMFGQLYIFHYSCDHAPFVTEMHAYKLLAVFSSPCCVRYGMVGITVCCHCNFILFFLFRRVFLVFHIHKNLCFTFVFKVSVCSAILDIFLFSAESESNQLHCISKFIVNVDTFVVFISRETGNL